MSRVLHLVLLDSDRERRRILSDYFSSHGFHITELEHGSAFIETLWPGQCDLLLAYSSRKVNDLTLIDDARRLGSCCIIITDRDDLIDRVIALELGADDYLDHDTDKREVLARVRVALRRKDREALAPPTAEGPDLSIRLDRIQRCLVHNGSITALTTAEFNLLVSLADNTNVSLTRERLYQLVYNRRWSALDRTLDTLVAKLRRKLEPDPEHPTLIKTVHGTGYIFTGVNFA